MKITPKERLLRACRREPVDRPPVWMMRQAGRYLPGYRKIRQEMTTLQMMKDPETACRVTVEPVETIGVDAAILYSDILIVPEAMGMKLDFVKEVGPVFERSVRSPQEVAGLNDQQVSRRCDFVSRTIALVKKRLPPDFPLLGFAGGPFTVGAYMTGGDGSYDATCLKKLALETPSAFQGLMKKVTAATIDYLKGQIAAGVDAVQLFDTWAGTLSVADYQTMALPWEREIFGALPQSTPTLLYIKGGGHLFDAMLESGANVISIDWRLPLSEARRRAHNQVAIQGNLDPARLYAPPGEIDNLVRAMLAEWGGGPGYIVNLGHGILPDVPVAHAKAFVEAAKRWGAKETDV